MCTQPLAQPRLGTAGLEERLAWVCLNVRSLGVTVQHIKVFRSRLGGRMWCVCVLPVVAILGPSWDHLESLSPLLSECIVRCAGVAPRQFQKIQQS